MIVRVYDGIEDNTPGIIVPITPETTCRDLIECCRDPGEDDCELVGIWANKFECALRENDRPLEILQRWNADGGGGRESVKLTLRYTPVQHGTVSTSSSGTNANPGRRPNLRNGMKEPGHFDETLPDVGVQLSLNELRDMAYRQQHQIESQHQLLAAKEQRLLYLKEQEARHQRVASENERLRRLRDRVEAQELKLRKLRALRGQVDQNKQNNALLTSDLDSIRALFNEKEKELSVAVAKVDELTRQLEDLRQGHQNNEPPSAPALELEKLRRELMYRNKLNEQQNARLYQQREALTQRQEEMSNIDKRISELQDRLHRKRVLNQQLANQITAASAKAGQLPNHPHLSHHNNIGSAPGLYLPKKQKPGNNIAAIEPYHITSQVPTTEAPTDKLGKNYFIPVITNQLKQTNLNDNINNYNKYEQLNNAKKQNHPPLKSPPPDPPNLQTDYITTEFGKSDPKYQTLPHNTKFSVNLLQLSTAPKKDLEEPKDMKFNNLKSGPQHHMTVHSTPLNLINKSLAVPLSQTQQKQQNCDQKPTINDSQQMSRGQPVGGPSTHPQNQSLPPSSFQKISSTKIQPVQPQTTIENPSEKSPKPILPPKPAPPPRQTTPSESSDPPVERDTRPIKAKPLTLKKQPPGAEVPRLRNGRRIEMPPAFLFENDAPPKDLVKDEVDKVIPEPVEEVIRRPNLKTGKTNLSRRVSFDPLALLLDASLEGELELVKKTAGQVPNPSAANDEGITALHNAICAGHLAIVEFLVEFGCDVNAQDSDGWTPLHCAASCNNLEMVRFLVEHGACIFATTLSDHETAAEKCEEDEEGFDGCSEYLYSVQEKLGILCSGAVYAVFDYTAQQTDELSFSAGNQITVLRKGDENEREWWWARLDDREGYIPRNLLGLYPRVTSKSQEA